MKRCVAAQGAPKAVGPYSQAVWAGEFLFLSGQIPIDPSTGAVVEGGIAEQTRRAIENMDALLAAQGLSLQDVIKTTVYLTDLADFLAMNDAYAGFFGSEPPARATVGVAALPKGVKVEIEAIAWRKGGPRW